jgi:hypothetical protein
MSGTDTTKQSFECWGRMAGGYRAGPIAHAQASRMTERPITPQKVRVAPGSIGVGGSCGWMAPLGQKVLCQLRLSRAGELGPESSIRNPSVRRQARGLGGVA